MFDCTVAVFPPTTRSKTRSDHGRTQSLIAPARLQTVIQEQQQQFPLLDYDQDLVAVCDFNGFLVALNPIGRQWMGVAPNEDLSLFQVRCFTPLTQDLWDAIFTSLLNEGLWSGDHILQYAGDPVMVKLLVMAHRPLPDQPQKIDCFSIVARVQTPPETAPAVSDGAQLAAEAEPIKTEPTVDPEVDPNDDRAQLIEALQSKTQYLEQALKNLQQARTQMVQAEKMSSLGQLVAGVAHEINNPVNFIYGNLKYANGYIDDLLGLLNQYRAAYPAPPEPIQAAIDDIDLDYLLEDLPRLFGSMKVGADRIREIVLSLRNFSRLDESQYKVADLHQGIDSTLMILQNRLKAQEHWPGVAVIREFGTLPLVPCFAGSLNQVFMNLLANAIDALEEAYMQGKITHPTIQIQTQVANDMVHLRFQDNGPGIPRDVQARLFDPFFTTKPVGKGTGMGLAISYQIICEQHHGFLTARSMADEGTTFDVRIPLQQQRVAQ